jgi:hypothetical protein
LTEHYVRQLPTLYMLFYPRIQIMDKKSPIGCPLLPSQIADNSYCFVTSF